MSRKYKVSVNDALNMAVELHKTGELTEAKSLYGNVLSVVPNHPDALHYLGVTLHQLGDSEEGIEQIERSLALSPDNAAAINNLGNIYRETGHLEDAEAAYRKVLEFAPQHADTLVNLGIILRERHQYQEAQNVIQRALEIDPKNAAGYHNLGNVFQSMGRMDDAIESFKRARELSAKDEKATLAMVNVLYAAGKKKAAIETLETMLKKYPGNPSAIHLLAAFSGENVPERASDRYVKQLFDSFSSSFDESLNRLDYRAPALVADKAMELLETSGRQYRILDIGCGTGLCGPLVKPLAKSLTGVDLSPGMLRKAKKKSAYDHLEEAELTEYMLATTNAFDVVLCVDTLVYFGNLSAALAAAANTLLPDGWLLFTVERHGDKTSAEGFRLQHHGRYSHRADYLENELDSAGFRVHELIKVKLRNEGKKPVKGILAVAQLQ